MLQQFRQLTAQSKVLLAVLLVESAFGTALDGSLVVLALRLCFVYGLTTLSTRSARRRSSRTAAAATTHRLRMAAPNARLSTPLPLPMPRMERAWLVLIQSLPLLLLHAHLYFLTLAGSNGDTDVNANSNDNNNYGVHPAQLLWWNAKVKSTFLLSFVVAPEPLPSGLHLMGHDALVAALQYVTLSRVSAAGGAALLERRAASAAAGAAPEFVAAGA